MTVVDSGGGEETMAIIFDFHEIGICTPEYALAVQKGIIGQEKDAKRSCPCILNAHQFIILTTCFWISSHNWLIPWLITLALNWCDQSRNVFLPDNLFTGWLGKYIAKERSFCHHCINKFCPFHPLHHPHCTLDD